VRCAAKEFTKRTCGSPLSQSYGVSKPFLLGRDGVSALFHQNSFLIFLVKMRYHKLMKTMLSAKLKLHTTPEQFKALRQTQLAYRDALNFVSQYAYAHGKMSNKVGLQEATYHEIRARFKLPAQMACSVPRQVGATYKALWTKVKQNAAARHPRA